MTVTHPPQMLAHYQPPRGSFDELIDADGGVRASWQQVGAALGDLGHSELVRRQIEVDRLLDADGVTYNAFGASDPRGRRWALDPVPVVIDSNEWASIERGVIQRAELLSLVLADLYGPRELLRRRLLPVEVVLGHPGFLRPCHRPGPSSDGGVPSPRLVTYAVDVARNAAGEYIALSDRTQAPSGAGYALENRLVISRVLPSMYRDAQVHRVAPFFRALRSALQQAAYQHSDPRIVVLTPGPWSETAFEHAYLASYLGYPLVEGGDLTVNGGRVWMRSLGRLEPVDVILRRVDDWYCDPLELKKDSRLGVPGLVDAARRGVVSIVNPLGSGIIESPAMLAFLPRLAEHLLGQPLRLPSVETWWCGDPVSRQHVLTNLSRLVVKPVARELGRSTILGWELSSADLAELRARIEAKPSAWTAQVALTMGTAPTLSLDGFEARRCVLRAFAVSRGDSYAVMPGGLMRVAADADSTMISNQSGALTKDAWVLASEPEKLTGFWLNNGPTIEAVDPVGSMPSRAAENLFWLGRYAERSETLVRLLRVVADRRNDFSSDANPAGSACLAILLGALTSVTTTYPGFQDPGRLASPGNEMFDLIVNESRRGTLAHSVRRLLDAAYAVRDQLSNDTWLVIGNLDREILELNNPNTEQRSAVQGALSRAMQSLLALGGLGAESMVRDPGWHFMDAGRRLERAMHLAELLRVTLVSTTDEATDSLILESLLTSAESIITYRRRYRSQAQVETVLDLLMLDRGNPRSLLFQLERLQSDVDALPRHTNDVLGADRLSTEERLVLETVTVVRLADTAALARPNREGRREQLDTLLQRIGSMLRQASDALDLTHFTHQMPQRSFLMASVEAPTESGVAESGPAESGLAHSGRA